MNKHILESFRFDVGEGKDFKFFIDEEDRSKWGAIIHTLMLCMGLNPNWHKEVIPSPFGMTINDAHRSAVASILKYIFGNYDLKRGANLNIPEEVIEHFKHNASKYYFTDSELWTRTGVITFPIKGYDNVEIDFKKDDKDNITVYVGGVYTAALCNDFGHDTRDLLDIIRDHCTHYDTLLNAAMVCQGVTTKDIQASIDRCENHPMIDGGGMVKVIELAIATQDFRLLGCIGMPLEAAQYLRNKHVACYKYHRQLWTRRGMIAVSDHRNDLGEDFVRLCDRGLEVGHGHDGLTLPNKVSSLQAIGKGILGRGKDLTQKERANIRWVLYLD